MCSYADNSDKILIFVGVVSAAANGELYQPHRRYGCSMKVQGLPGDLILRLLAGAILPLFTVVFGSIINTIGKGQYQSKADFQHEIDHVCLYFVYLACAAGVASYFEVSDTKWPLS